MATVKKRKENGKLVNNFLTSTILPGYHYITEKNRNSNEKYFWIIIEILIMFLTIFLFINVWEQFMNNPTVTTLETTAYPIKNVPFPAVSICNINKISKRKIEKLIKDIKSLDVQLDQNLINNFKLLGNFYDYETREAEELDQLQNVLELYQTAVNISINQFNPLHLIRSLITPCDELIKKCSWGGEIVECNTIFTKRRTFEGYCCIFNYIKETNDARINKLPQQQQTEAYTQDAGIINGLTVEINNEPEDYFYPTLASIGVTVHIFHPPDYPDIYSGSLTQFLVGSGSETFMEINPITMYAIEDVIRYPVEKRNCVFAKEKSTLLGNYTESDCKVDCRIKSMLALCDCIPFMIPVSKKESRICSLTDLSCLKKYQNKWMSTYPYTAEEVEELDREVQDALRCDNICYPECDVTLYEVSLNIVPLKDYENSSSKIEKSVIHIFFQSPISHLYKKDVVYYWFEILAYFGGLGGLTIGVSLISLIEFIVFFSYRSYICRNN